MTHLLLFTATLLFAIVAATPTTHPERKMITITHHVTVNIENDFSPESGVEVTVHCKSADDDLGDEGAGPGVAITWEFRPNVFGTTLYHCTATGNPAGGILRFDAYDYQRDAGDRCNTQCNWIINSDGAIGTDQSTGSQDLRFSWQH